MIQEAGRSNQKLELKYPIERIVEALSAKRLGGVCFISITASGETFLPKELDGICLGLLKEGHFINITTNGTLSRRIDDFLSATSGFHERIHISFSLHYVELINHGLLDAFWENVKKVKQAGCSILVQINLSDEYFDCWDEVKGACLKNVGALPQVALTRKESKCGYSILTSHSEEEYVAKAREMKSPLFDFTYKMFNVKRKEFCYAGFVSAKLNLATGIMTGCYGAGIKQNVFDDVNSEIRWQAIGNNCPFKYCFNSSHFLSQGCIPELEPLESYSHLRNRVDAEWESPLMVEFLSQKLATPVLSSLDKWKINFHCFAKKSISRICALFR